MTAQETNLLNAFETTLTAQMGPTDLTATVQTTSSLATPAYLVIEPEVVARREYILFDAAFTATTFVTTGTGKRYLTGSAAGSGLTHPVGSVVRMAPLAQHFEDLHDRIDAQDHGDLAGLGDDDHTQYVKADGTRAFTGKVEGVAPTAAAHLTTKGWADGAFTPLSHKGSTAVADHPQATPSVRGFMSSADKSKLDGIETAATKDQTAAEILTAVKTVDGAGSGLNADLLDGTQLSTINAAIAAADAVADVAQADIDNHEAASNPHGITAAGISAAPLSHKGSTATSDHPQATPSVRGFMSSADKSKLDGIETAATKDQTAAEIVALIKATMPGVLLAHNQWTAVQAVTSSYETVIDQELTFPYSAENVTVFILAHAIVTDLGENEELWIVPRRSTTDGQQVAVVNPNAFGSVGGLAVGATVLADPDTGSPITHGAGNHSISGTPTISLADRAATPSALHVEAVTPMTGSVMPVRLRAKGVNYTGSPTFTLTAWAFRQWA